MIGNRAVSRMMLPGGGTVQAKMNVTAADDAQEREADAMAEHAMRSINDTSAQPASVQREGEEDEVMAKRIQREGDEDEMMAKRIQRQGARKTKSFRCSASNVTTKRRTFRPSVFSAKATKTSWR
ncbi:MAG: hypothetical protein HND48_03320 [Chloroflexi bacterium]|nr:hypothetical protein [Chloroflexota bacterium]